MRRRARSLACRHRNGDGYHPGLFIPPPPVIPDPPADPDEPPPSGPGELLFATTYDEAASLSPSFGGWKVQQEPRVKGVYVDRATLIENVDVPGTGTYRPAGRALRIENRPFQNLSDAQWFTLAADTPLTSDTLTFNEDLPADLIVPDLDLFQFASGSEYLYALEQLGPRTIKVRRHVHATGVLRDQVAGAICKRVTGDVNPEALSSRVECYMRNMSPSGTPPSQWPDPVGAERWWGFPLLLPSDFPTEAGKWLTLMQWKGQFGGSPRSAIEYNGGQTLKFRNAGTSWTLPMTKGQWVYVQVGQFLSGTSTKGWVELWVDETQTLTRTARQTMDTRGTSVDPIYTKQGLYRTKDWLSTCIAYFGKLKIGTSRDTVGP